MNIIMTPTQKYNDLKSLVKRMRLVIMVYFVLD